MDVNVVRFLVACAMLDLSYLGAMSFLAHLGGVDLFNLVGTIIITPKALAVLEKVGLNGSAAKLEIRFDEDDYNQVIHFLEVWACLTRGQGPVISRLETMGWWLLYDPSDWRREALRLFLAADYNQRERWAQRGVDRYTREGSDSTPILSWNPYH